MSDTKLRDIISQIKHTKTATDTGKKMHTKMQGIIMSDTAPHGDAEIRAKIAQHPELTHFFTPNSKSEVPIAGHINGKFISRRIDRLIIDGTNKTIDILDYKTDTNKTAFIDKRENINSIIRNISAQLKDKYKDFKLKKIPVLPDICYVDDITFELKGLDVLPIGIEINSLEVYVYDFLKNRINIISGKYISSHIYFFYALIHQFIMLNNVKAMEVLIAKALICLLFVIILTRSNFPKTSAVT